MIEECSGQRRSKKGLNKDREAVGSGEKEFDREESESVRGVVRVRSRNDLKDTSSSINKVFGCGVLGE